MRKYMTKDVTITTIKIAKVGMDENGLPVVNVLDDVIQLGSVSQQKAQKLIKSMHGIGVSIYNMEEKTETYKMEVEEFIKVATKVQEGEELEGEEEELEGEEEEEEEEKEESEEE